jgi:hypothetical protein
VQIPYLEKAPHVEITELDMIIRPTSCVYFQVVKHALFSSVYAVLLHYRAKGGRVQCSDLLSSAYNARVSKHIFRPHYSIFSGVTGLSRCKYSAEPRSERNELLHRSARPHVVLLIFSFRFRFVIQDDVRVPITVFPALTASPFTFPFFYASRLALPDNTQPTQVTTTRQP